MMSIAIARSTTPGPRRMGAASITAQTRPELILGSCYQIFSPNLFNDVNRNREVNNTGAKADGSGKRNSPDKARLQLNDSV